MKQATELWRKFAAKEINAEEAMRQLNVLFAGASGPDTAKLSGIYQKILDSEFPETKVDKEADEAFWKATHPSEED